MIVAFLNVSSSRTSLVHCFSKYVNPFTSLFSVDPKRIWIIFGRNTARGIYTLLLCKFIIWLCSQEPACVAMVSDLKKRLAQELTAAPDLCEKKLLHQFLLTGLHFLQMKNFHGSSTSQQSKWLRVCSRDYHDVTPLPTNSYSYAWLSVNQSWVAQVWCLWTLAKRLMAAITVMNCSCCCLFIGKLSCCKVKCVHMKQVWWYITYTLCYQLSKVYFW